MADQQILDRRKNHHLHMACCINEHPSCSSSDCETCFISPHTVATILRWKRFALVVAMCILAVGVVILQLAFYLSIQVDGGSPESQCITAYTLPFHRKISKYLRFLTSPPCAPSHFRLFSFYPNSTALSRGPFFNEGTPITHGWSLILDFAKARFFQVNFELCICLGQQCLIFLNGMDALMPQVIYANS
ncbi:hypothetical protein SLEP1_g53956 [Rubroshorea leprosula]|uniref:Uncharacterized protein n=1 Tax=Rubroshorea leprosula TaxID=152421 RepID=A0AAV5MBU3_9ROSI|nr:hypothetical protein SLEP1_g53956 [Rubroshorea leprosula]